MFGRRAMLAAGLAAPALKAQAQERPIQVMVGFTPGGNIDLAARMAAPFLEKYLGGQQIIVVNRPGAGGMIMLNEVSAAPADGRIAALVCDRRLPVFGAVSVHDCGGGGWVVERVGVGA